MGRVSGKIALVTGAASGIGRGTSIALAAEGARVIVTDVDDKGGHETVDIVRKAGGDATFYHHDVSNDADWEKITAAVKKDFGGLNVLVNNAAICISVSLFKMSTESYRRQNTINIDSVFFGMKYLIPVIAASGGIGSVINVSSAAGLIGLPGMVGYCGTKGAVRMMTKAAALECGRDKLQVRVNSLHPGGIETPIWLKLANDGEMPDPNPKSNDPYAESRKATEDSTSLGIVGQPHDMAAGIVFLASDEFRFMTGSELVMDGGATAG